jgi:hypothetical protein
MREDFDAQWHELAENDGRVRILDGGSKPDQRIPQR